MVGKAVEISSNNDPEVLTGGWCTLSLLDHMDRFQSIPLIKSGELCEGCFSLIQNLFIVQPCAIWAGTELKSLWSAVSAH